jgi:hypothetical protein
MSCLGVVQHKTLSTIQNVDHYTVLFVLDPAKVHKPVILGPFLDERQAEVIYELPAKFQLKIPAKI